MRFGEDGKCRFHDTYILICSYARQEMLCLPIPVKPIAALTSGQVAQQVGSDTSDENFINSSV